MNNVNSFELLMEKEIPGYKNILSEAQLLELRYYYDQKNKCQEAINDITSSVNSNSEIDYSNIIERNIDKKIMADNNFQIVLDSIKKSLVATTQRNR